MMQISDNGYWFTWMFWGVSWVFGGTLLVVGLFAIAHVPIVW